MKMWVKVFAGLVLLVLASGEAFAANLYWVGSAGGNTNDSNNWSSSDPTGCSGGGAGVPGSADIAIFDADCDNSATINANLNVGGIDIKSGYTGTVTQSSGITITVGTSNYVQADGTFTGGNSTIDINGSFTLSGGTYTATSGTTTLGRGNFTHTAGGTFTHNGGLWTFDGGDTANITVDVSTSETFGSVTVTLAGGFTLVVSSGDTMIVTGALTLNNSIIDTGTIEARGDVTINSTADGGTATLNVTTNSTPASTITLAAGGKAPNFNLNDSTATATTSGTGSFTFDNSFTLSAGTMSMSAVNIVVDTTSTFSGGTLNLNTATNHIFTGAATVSGATVNTNSSTVHFNNTFSISSGTFNGNTGVVDHNNNLTISGGTYSATSDTVTGTTLGRANFTHTAAGGTFTHNGGLWTFDGGDTADNTVDVSTSETFGSVTVTLAGGFNLVVSSGDSMIVTGALTLNNSIINTGTIEAQGNVTVASTFDGGTAPLKFSGSATQTFDLTGATGLFNADISVNKSGGQVNLASALVMDAANQDLLIEEGTFDLNGQNLTVNGSSGQLDVQTGGNLQLQGGETVTANASNPDLQSGGTVTYDGTSTYTVKDWTYGGNLTFNGSGGTFNLGANETVTGNLTLTAGTFDISGYNLTVSGTFSNSATFQLQGAETFTGTMDTDSGTVVYDGTGTYGSGLVGGDTYNNLTFNGTGGSWTLDANLDVNSTLTITAGTLSANAKKINVGGNWSNSGTFTHGNNEVVFDGSSQTISGTNTFYKLTKATTTAVTLTFPQGNTTTIANTALAYGTSSNSLSFRSSSNGNAATVNFQGATALQYVDVKDINNSNATSAKCYLGCTNSGNNTNFAFTLSTNNETTQDWEFNDGTPSNTLDFNSTYISVNSSSDSKAKLVDLGSGTYGIRGGVVGLENWTKYQTITITNNVDAVLTNYSIRLAVTYDADMQADFDDLRFVNSSGTVLDHWIESKTDSTSAVVWVEVNSIAASSSGTTAIKMYYGYSSASTSSSCSSTFLFCDDFSGASLAGSWTEVTVGGASAGTLSGGKWTKACNGECDWWSTSALDGGAYISDPLTTDKWEAVTSMTSTTHITNSHFGMMLYEAASDGYAWGYVDGDPDYYWTGITGGATSCTMSNTTSTAYLKIAKTTSNGSGQNETYKFYRGDDSSTWTQCSTYAPSDVMSKVGLFVKDWASGSISADFDYFFVKKVTTSEPSTAFGSETAAVAASDLDIFPKAAGTHPSFGDLWYFQETLGGSNAGTIYYLISRDASTWYAHNGTAWAAVTVDATFDPSVSANVAALVNSYISTFDSDVGTGDFYFRAFLVSNGSQQVELDKIRLTYRPSNVNPSTPTSLGATSYVNGSDNSDNTPTLSFTLADDDSGQQVKYQIQIDDSSDFSSPVVDYTSALAAQGATSFTVGQAAGSGSYTTGSSGQTLSDGYYYWRVKNIDASAASSANATANSGSIAFAIEATVPSIHFSATSSSGSEATASPTIAISLSESNFRNVTVNYAVSGGTATGSGTDYTLASGTATITAGNTSVNISPSIVSDALDEDDETIAVTLSSPGSASLGANTVHTYTITDDDATPTVTLSLNSATIAEAAAVATFTATLSAVSGRDVTVNLSASGTATGSGTDYTLSGTSITITAGNTTGTRTVTAVQDTTDEDDETVIIDVSSVTNGTESGTQQQTATITDDDAAPNVTLSVNNATIAEDGSVATVTATLAAASGKTVTVNLSASGTGTGSGTDYTLSGTSITINAGSTTGTRTVTSVADSIDESNETAIVDIDSITNGTEATPQQVTITVTDDDTAGVTVTQSGGSTNATEGGSSDTYTVVLNTQPTANVTITLSPGVQASVGLTTTLTFTSANWNTVQTVTASAVNDQVAEGNHTGTITHSAASSDSNYHGISISNVTVNITDNDSAGISVTESSGATAATEGGATDTYTVVLTSEPTANVSVSISVSEDLSRSASTLTFTAANWNTSQTVTITAVDDDLAEGNHTGTITHAASSSDSNYNALSINGITASLTDNDSVGITVSHTGGSTAVAEGGATDTYTIVLNSQPFNDVTITVNPGSQITLSATTLTFTALNWETPQTLTVTSVNDSLAEGNHNATLTHTSASADTGYNNLTINNLTVNISDNETAGITVTQSAGATSVSEAGTTDTYTIVLTSQPTATVTIAMTAGSQVTVTPTSFTFTTTNWNAAQTATVSAAADFIDEDTLTATITHAITTTDTDYTAAQVSSVSVSVSDDDTAGVTITESNAATAVTEGGATDTYTVVLTSQPTSNVTISTATGTQLTTATTPLTFTSTNWNTAQTVTVTAVDDTEIEANPHTGTITHALSSSDSKFTALAALSTITVSIAENDEEAQESDDNAQGNDDVCGASSCVTPEEVEGVLIAARGANEILLAQDVTYANRSCNRLDLPNDTTVYTTDTTIPTVLFYGDNIVIADSAHDNDTGRVFLLPIGTANQTLDMTTVESNLPGGALLADGSQVGDLFGADIESGDYNCDEEEEVWVLATGTSYGTVEVLDENFDTIYLVLGSSAEPVTSITSAGLGASCGNDMIASVESDTEASLNASRFAIAANSNVVASSSQFYGILASQNAATVINFATDSPDYVVSTGTTVSHMVAGDINGDGIGDLILASAENCELMVILGGTDIGSSTTTLTPDYTSTCSEDTDLASLAVGDVNADGYDDVLVGFPQAQSGNGTIYVMAGARSVTSNSVSFSNASTITGSSSTTSLGQWIVINDSDGNGTNDVYTSSGETSSYTFEAAGLIDTGTGTSSTTGGGITSGSLSGSGCALERNIITSDTKSVLLLLLNLVFLLGLRVGCDKRKLKAGKINSPF